MTNDAIGVTDPTTLTLRDMCRGWPGASMLISEIFFSGQFLLERKFLKRDCTVLSDNVPVSYTRSRAEFARGKAK